MTEYSEVKIRLSGPIVEVVEMLEEMKATGCVHGYRISSEPNDAAYGYVTVPKRLRDEIKLPGTIEDEWDVPSTAPAKGQSRAKRKK